MSTHPKRHSVNMRGIRYSCNQSENTKVLHMSNKSTGQVVRLEVSILRVLGSYPTQWTSMYVLVNPNLYGTG
jgi:hypothetical protein